MKIFLSAVSNQFVECRKALFSDLHAMGAEVVTQEHFQQHGRTLLEKLEESIAKCDRVIALIGDSYGFEPEEPARPAGRPRRSYTQWEYYFAMGERLDGTTAPRKDVYVYVATDIYLKAHPVTQESDVAEIQKAFLKKVRASGEDRNKFDSLDQLCRLALRDGFRVRDPDRKPKNLPFGTIGELFKGRDAFLDDLRRKFDVPDGQARAIVPAKAVHGLGGVGKTRAAVEYAWRFEKDYGALLFVSAPSADELHARLADLVGVLAIETSETAIEPRLRAVLRWLDDHPGWLLIVDNVDTPEAATAIQKLMAYLRSGHVLITSRITHWPAGVEPLELHVLDEPDAVAFLLERTRQRRKTPNDNAEALAIAKMVDGLALALEQAGAYIETKRLSFAEYRKDWESKRTQVLNWHNERLMGYPASVAVTWETSFARLDPPAQSLLRVLSWLAPQPIPLSLFEAKPLIAKIAEPREALANLSAYSLARFSDDGDTVTVHRLVQEIARARSSEADRLESLRVALNVLAALVPFAVNDVRTWSVMTPLVPHAETVARHGDEQGIAEPTATLMNQLGQYYQARAQLQSAEPLMRRALAIAESSQGPDHPNVAIRLNNLAGLLRATNRLAETEPLYRRALAIFESSYGLDHPNVASCLNNLAELLRATNRLAEAEPLYRRALAIDEASYGLDHPKVATDLNNLAALLQATNRLAEAEPLYRRGLVILWEFQRQTGHEHPNFQVVLANYVVVLKELRRTPEEIELAIRDLFGLRPADGG